LAHNTPHIPLGAKPQLVEKYKGTFNPTYAAMMETMDDTVGLLLAKLAELKLVDNTIVIFASDNGGLHVLEFPDSPATHNTPYRAGKGFLYEGGLRVPLIIRWPGVVPAGKVSDVPVMQQDFTPTLLEACGVKADGPFDGVSVMSLLKGEKLAERTLYWHFPHYTNQGGRPAGAVREGRWKLIEHYEDGRTEVFDLEKDISEEIDLAAREPDRAKTMREKLTAWRNEMKAQENTPNPAFDAALHKKLYVDTDVSQLKAGRTAAEMRVALQEWRDGMDAVLPKKSKK
jgi:arylsulfatase A-like enzyme